MMFQAPDQPFLQRLTIVLLEEVGPQVLAVDLPL
jgi:hypothetical protein